MATMDDMLAGFEPLADVDAINTLADLDKYIVLRLEQLVPYEHNREIPREKAELMAASLRDDGQLQALLVRPRNDGLYEISAGNTRYFGQLINADLYPDEPRYRTLKAIVRDMSDAEMLKNNLVANLYMNAPSGTERAELYEQLRALVPELRTEDPDRYAGVPTAQIVADAVNEMGGSTSRATVNRDLKAARERKEADAALEHLDKAWRPIADDGAISDGTILRLAGLDGRTQRKIYADYVAGGRKKGFLAERLACTNVDDAEKLMLRSVKGVVKEMERLVRIRRLGYYVEPDEIRKAQELLAELETIGEEERL